ncbi:MAG: ferric reductase-like transmembrane domain-containing protein [Alphaproteobacteria bacterium]|nr:ferric reductase-like transmembrane domain-containing protein [Alphaproteobacteria bacterium]
MTQRRPPARALSTRLPWNDRGGRLSPLKAATLLGLCLPGLLLAFDLAGRRLGPMPISAAIHETGLWAIRFLLLSLTITPLRRTMRWPRVMQVRRMVGVAAFAYVAAHLVLYAVDLKLDLARVASEIVLRFYLTIGFVALLLLAALAATSTDAMIRRLGGRRWQLLHRAVYGAAVLGVAHHFLQSKLNVTEPTIMAGFLIWLLGSRLLAAADDPVRLALLSGAAAAATVLGEAAWFGLATGADPLRVLAANLDISFGLRPGPIVLLSGFAVTAVVLARATLRMVRPAVVR